MMTLETAITLKKRARIDILRLNTGIMWYDSHGIDTNQVLVKDRDL